MYENLKHLEIIGNSDLKAEIAKYQIHSIKPQSIPTYSHENLGFPQPGLITDGRMSWLFCLNLFKSFDVSQHRPVIRQGGRVLKWTERLTTRFRVK